MATRGFTLLELLVAMAIVALIIAAVPILMTGGFSGATLKSEVTNVVNELRAARYRAIHSNEAVRFIVDAENGRYEVAPGGRSGKLGGETTIRLVPRAAMQSDTAGGVIGFFPDGSSTGGRLTISTERQKFEVVIDWLTGRISVDE